MAVYDIDLLTIDHQYNTDFRFLVFDRKCQDDPPERNADVESSAVLGLIRYLSLTETLGITEPVDIY